MGSPRRLLLALLLLALPALDGAGHSALAGEPLGRAGLPMAVSGTRPLLTCGPVGWPTLLTPADGAEVGGADLTLQWAEVGGADHYRVQIDDDDSFDPPLVDVSVYYSSGRYTQHDTLQPGTYYWRVQSVCNPYESNWTVAWHFTVCSPGPTTLVSPFGGTFGPTGIPLQWNALEGATSYEVQVDETHDFASPNPTTITAATAWAVPGPLASGNYFWRVRAGNSCGYGPWNQVGTGNFYVCGGPPVAPAPHYPADGGDLCATGDHLFWYAVDHFTAYQVQVDDEAGFATPVYSATQESQWYDLPGELPASTYYWHVRACNPCGDSPWSPTWSFQAKPYPGQPALRSPTDGTTRSGTNITLDWFGLDYADSYRVELDDSAAFAGLVYSASVTAFQCAIPGTLDPGEYYWRVRASNVCGSDAWSATWHFHACAAPGQPGLVWPPDGVLAPRVNVPFRWGSVAGAIRYRLEVDDSIFFAGAIVTETKAITYTLPGPLAMDTTYYWRVAAYNGCTWGGWSGTRSFYTCASAPVGKLQLLAPADKAIVLPSDITLDWDDLADAYDYHVQVDDGADFSPALLSATTMVSQYTIDHRLVAGTYYWHVRPLNDCGPGTWAGPASFEVGPSVYLPLVLR